MSDSPGAFERDTTYRLLVEAARHWCISHELATGKVPERGQWWVYPDAPAPIPSFGWGNAPGEQPPGQTPLRGKRYRITMELEEATV